MQIGVVTNGFGHFTSAELAARFASWQLDPVQVFFTQKEFAIWRYNGRPPREQWNHAKAAAAINAYRKEGLQVLSLGVYTNLLEPDPEERAENLRYFAWMFEVAVANGVGTVATECGFIPGRRGLVRETFEADWARLIDSFQRLGELAERYEVTVALEPCFHDLVNSARRARDFVRQVGSPRVRIQLDPGNLVTVNTEDEMFANLADVTVAVHGKDRKVNAALGTLVGEGDVDWAAFMRLYLTWVPHAPFFLEYVNDQTVEKARDFIRQAVAAP